MPIDAIGSGGFTPINFPSFERAAGIEKQNGSQDGTAGFTNKLTDALNNLNKTQATADDLAVQAASGNLKDIHDYSIAASKAEIATSLTVAVRNKAVESFNQIMNMQV